MVDDGFGNVAECLDLIRRQKIDDVTTDGFHVARSRVDDGLQAEIGENDHRSTPVVVTLLTTNQPPLLHS